MTIHGDVKRCTALHGRWMGLDGCFGCDQKTKTLLACQSNSFCTFHRQSACNGSRREFMESDQNFHGTCDRRRWDPSPFRSHQGVPVRFRRQLFKKRRVCLSVLR